MLDAYNKLTTRPAQNTSCYDDHRIHTMKTKLAYLKEEGNKLFAIYPALNKRREAGKGHPEEQVRLETYNKLIEKYGYPTEFLDIEVPVYIRADETPRYADIVVFDDKEQKRPFIVAETKKPNREDGERQGQRYATILRAVYVLWTNGSSQSACAIVNRYPEEAAAIKDIPAFGGQPKYAIDKLEPFKDDREIATKFRKCHDLIRNLNNLKPDEAFTEFLKILLVKLEDEAKPGEFDFQILLRNQPPQPEPPNETAQRIRLLFKNAVERETEYSSVFKGENDIALTNECIAQLVGLLQRFSLSDSQVDQKGRAFETFLSGDMRQEFKEFMTPRPVIEAVVEMAEPDPTVSILDPCCGSGAFLIYSLRYVRRQIEANGVNAKKQVKAIFDFAHDHLFGFDDSEQMAAVARINMLVNEDGRAHVFKHNSLYPRADAPYVTQQKYFDFIFTNPPFGKRISKPSSLLESFHITRDKKGRIKKGGFITEVLFLERNLEWLRPKGQMFIVLPDSVLGNSTLREERAYIERMARLIGVISLSADTFGPSGAKSKTSIAVFEKRAKMLDEDEVAEDYPVFVADVQHVGYDFTGRATAHNQLPELVEEYKRFRKTGESKSSLSAVVSRSQLGFNWLAQEYIQSRKKKDQAGQVTLDEVCESISVGKTAPRGAYTNKGLHMVKVGNLTGKGIEWNAVERQYVQKSFADANKRAILRAGDILFTAAAHGPKWIGLKVDLYEGAPEEIPQPVLCCGELMICRPRRKATVKGQRTIDPHFLLLYLRSAAGYEAIQHCIRGQSGHVYPDEVRTIKIPDPELLDQIAVKQAILDLKAATAARAKAAQSLEQARVITDKLFPSSVRKPIIAT